MNFYVVNLEGSIKSAWIKINLVDLHLFLRLFWSGSDFSMKSFSLTLSDLTLDFLD